MNTKVARALPRACLGHEAIPSNKGMTMPKALGCLVPLVATIIGSCAAPLPVDERPPQAEARHLPGDILESGPFPGAPDGATATRILYTSTAPDGAAVTVSGLVIVPKTPAPPAGRRVLAWLHPTTGVDRACAPTLGPAPFTQIQGLPLFLAAGYAVVATDYPGLGAPGIHPYLVGTSEAHAVLDSVRAALQLPGVQAGPRFAVWGHSQGGHAALFTGHLARQYAPELQLVGVAAAAPVTDIAALVEKPGQDPLWGAVLSYTVWSWSRVLQASPGIVSAASRPIVERAARDCLETSSELQQLQADTAPLAGEPVSPDARWRNLLAENAPTPRIEAPVFLAQGSDDPVIPAPLTRTFARRLCKESASLHYLAMPGVDHYTAAMRSAASAAAWIAERFAGVPPPNDCPALQEPAPL
jgi:pimeloyl-ACP methyl ester carboxylesterase